MLTIKEIKAKIGEVLRDISKLLDEMEKNKTDEYYDLYDMYETLYNLID